MTTFSSDIVSSSRSYPSEYVGAPSMANEHGFLSTRLPSLNELLAGAPPPSPASVLSSERMASRRTPGHQHSPPSMDMGDGPQPEAPLLNNPREASPDFSSMPLAAWAQSRVTPTMASASTAAYYPPMLPTRATSLASSDRLGDSYINGHCNAHDNDNDEDDDGDVSLAVMAAGLGIMLGPNTSSQYTPSVQQSPLFTPPNSQSKRKRPTVTTNTNTAVHTSGSDLPLHQRASAYGSGLSVSNGGLASPVSAQPKSPNPLSSSSSFLPSSSSLPEDHQIKKTRHYEVDSILEETKKASHVSALSMNQSQHPVTPPSPPPTSNDQHTFSVNYRSAPSYDLSSPSVVSSATTSPLITTPGPCTAMDAASAVSSPVIEGEKWTHRRHVSSSSAVSTQHRPQHRRDLSASTFMSTLTLDDDLPLSASTRAHASFSRPSHRPHLFQMTVLHVHSSSTATTTTNTLSTMTAHSMMGRFACPDCGKLYKHPGCLGKHRWEHHEHWSSVSRLLLTKHQQVQLMEAAQILITIANNDHNKTNSSQLSTTITL
ncbi:hypothetical protein BDF19DRAFT_426244 [Syncephalis fuscata]|nr:hypothetical protein BDF19DRAFT_426244 [Syncephalis fuscata]